MVEQYYYRRQIFELLDCDEKLLEELEAEELVVSTELASEAERVFSPDQVERIRIASNLVRDLDVNVAGCAVILEMRENMMRMCQRFDRILEIIADELGKRAR
jgi:DNA-binding transcriptional MerR regulator